MKLIDWILSKFSLSRITKEDYKKGKVAIEAEKYCTCVQPTSHTTSFTGLEPLRALFSGEISSEEYSKTAPDVMFVTHCGDCGKER